MGCTTAGDNRTVCPSVADWGDAAHELEEMRCADDRKWNWGGLDQVFLGHLRAEVSTCMKGLGADNGQRNVVPYASGRFRGNEVTP